MVARQPDSLPDRHRSHRDGRHVRGRDHRAPRGLPLRRSGHEGNPTPSSAISAAISLSGGVPGAAAYTGPGDAPALLFHGTADTIIPFGWSVETAVASLGAGVYVNLQPFPDAGHVPYTQFRDQIVTQTVNFLSEQLHLDTAAT